MVQDQPRETVLNCTVAASNTVPASDTKVSVNMCVQIIAGGSGESNEMVRELPAFIVIGASENAGIEQSAPVVLSYAESVTMIDRFCVRLEQLVTVAPIRMMALFLPKTLSESTALGTVMLAHGLLDSVGVDVPALAVLVAAPPFAAAIAGNAASAMLARRAAAMRFMVLTPDGLRLLLIVSPYARRQGYPTLVVGLRR